MLLFTLNLSTTVWVLQSFLGAIRSTTVTTTRSLHCISLLGEERTSCSVRKSIPLFRRTLCRAWTDHHELLRRLVSCDPEHRGLFVRRNIGYVLLYLATNGRFHMSRLSSFNLVPNRWVYCSASSPWISVIALLQGRFSSKNRASMSRVPISLSRR